MKGDVRQALLSHPINHELSLRVEVWQGSHEPALELDAGALIELLAEDDQCAEQAESVQRFGTQAVDDVLDLDADRPQLLLGRPQLSPRATVGLFGDAPQAQHHAGDALIELVVELPRQASPLILLSQEGSATHLSALGLEPLKHPVEDRAYFVDLRAL